MTRFIFWMNHPFNYEPYFIHKLKLIFYKEVRHFYPLLKSCGNAIVDFFFSFVFGEKKKYFSVVSQLPIDVYPDKQKYENVWLV